MGIPSFEQTEITHESKNMKLIAGLAAVAAAQQAGTPVNPLMPVMPAMPGMPAMNPLLMSMLFKDGSSGSNDDLLMMMMMGGNMGQMNPLMLSMLFDSDDYASLKKICDGLTEAIEKSGCTDELAKISTGDKLNDCADDCTAQNASIKKIKDMNKDDMSDLMLMMMLGGQGMGGDMNSMLPFLLMKDGGLKDNKNLMLMMMMQGQGNMMAGGMNPLLMMSLLE